MMLLPNMNSARRGRKGKPGLLCEEKSTGGLCRSCSSASQNQIYEIILDLQPLDNEEMYLCCLCQYSVVKSHGDTSRQ